MVHTNSLPRSDRIDDDEEYRSITKSPAQVAQEIEDHAFLIKEVDRAYPNMGRVVIVCASENREQINMVLNSIDLGGNTVIFEDSRPNKPR